MKKKLWLALCCMLAVLSLSACNLLLADTSGASEQTDLETSFKISSSESIQESSVEESLEESTEESFIQDSWEEEFSAEDSIEESPTEESSVKESSLEESSVEESSVEESSVEENSSEENVQDSTESEQPDAENTEIDRFGHKIVYYEDGTWADLGRVTPMDFTPRAASERYGYQYLLTEEKGEELGAFYVDLYETSAEFFSATTDVTLKYDEYYPIAEIDCTAYTTLTLDDKVAVWKTFKQDCPEFFWLGNVCYTVGNLFGLCIDEAYASAETRESTQDAIESATLEFDVYINGKMNEVELAVSVYDYLATSVVYAYEEDGATPSDEVWAHNIVGWATRGEGVCETYAEVFTYLCSFYDIESSVVVGVAGATADTMGGHAWNIVNLGGEWYTVDVTWSSIYKDNFVDRQWFGKAVSEFNETHVANTPQGVGKDYQFELPTLSDKTVSPVLLQENGGAAEWVLSVDKAFEKMTNEGSRYEITLYTATKVLEKKSMSVYPVGAKLYTDLPKVAELVISCEPKEYKSYLGSIGFVTSITVELHAQTPLTLSGTLVLDNVDMYAPSWSLGSFEVKTENGAHAYIE